MTENLANTIKDWCTNNLSEETTRQLDSGQAEASPVYRDFAEKGWLAYADIFQDKENFRKLCEIGKIVSGYSSVISNMIGVNCVCSMLLTTFGSERQKEIGRKVLKGDIFTCFSLTEPDAGRAPVAICRRNQ